MWKHPLPKFLEIESPTASFFKLPSNEPVNVLIRVYVIRVSIYPVVIFSFNYRVVEILPYAYL